MIRVKIQIKYLLTNNYSYNAREQFNKGAVAFTKSSIVYYIVIYLFK